MKNENFVEVRAFRYIGLLACSCDKNV